MIDFCPGFYYFFLFSYWVQLVLVYLSCSILLTGLFIFHFLKLDDTTKVIFFPFKILLLLSYYGCTWGTFTSVLSSMQFNSWAFLFTTTVKTRNGFSISSIPQGYKRDFITTPACLPSPLFPHARNYFISKFLTLCKLNHKYLELCNN